MNVMIPPEGNGPCTIQELVPAYRPPTAFSLPHQPDGPPASVTGRYNRLVQRMGVAQPALLMLLILFNAALLALFLLYR